jgi:enoyl-CoA hydratase/carnithine racemase
MTTDGKGPVRVERDGRIVRVTFDSGRRGNPMSRSAMHALLDTALELERDPDISAIVLTGPPGLFTYGFDLSEGAPPAELGLAQRREILAVGPRMCAAWERLEPLTILATEGWCVGGGVALAAAFDLRVTDTTGGFYVPEVERGMNMSWGSVPRLVNLVGPSRAKRLVMLAERIDGPTAAAWGLVDECVPAGQSLARAMEFAQRAAAMPPIPLRMCKAGINAYANALAASAAALDRDQFLLAQMSEDYQEGVRAFMEKRPPVYRGR